MRKRWVIYIIIGILFGVFAFYYQEFTKGINVNSYAMWFLVAWGIGLIPIIPIALHEAKVSNHRDPFYWSNLKSILLGDVLGSIGKWIGVAVVGGFITGFLISFIYLSLRKIHNVKIETTN